MATMLPDLMGTGVWEDRNATDAASAAAREDPERLKIFLSYSRADIDFADQMVMLLKATGFEPIIDRHDIDAAENWKQRLGDLIFACDTVLVVLTDTSAKSQTCAWEVEHATALGKRLIPILPRACVAPSPQKLAELNYIQMFRDPNLPGTSFADGMEKLNRALRIDLAWIRMQTRLSERAVEWRRSASDDRLLRGHALSEAEDWLSRTPHGATVDTVTRDYFNASAQAEARLKSEVAHQLAEREAAIQKANRASARVRVASIVGAAVSSAMVVLAIVAWWWATTIYDQADDFRAQMEATSKSYETELVRARAEQRRLQDNYLQATKSIAPYAEIQLLESNVTSLKYAIAELLAAANSDEARAKLQSPDLADAWSAFDQPTSLSAGNREAVAEGMRSQAANLEQLLDQLRASGFEPVPRLRLPCDPRSPGYPAC